jgi:hypothetical protein
LAFVNESEHCNLCNEKDESKKKRQGAFKAENGREYSFAFFWFEREKNAIDRDATNDFKSTAGRVKALVEKVRHDESA